VSVKEYFSPGFTLPASEAEVEGSNLTLKKPVGVSLISTYGFSGSFVVVVLPDLVVGVGVTEVFSLGDTFGVIVGVDVIRDALDDASSETVVFCGDPERANFKLAITL